MTTLGLIGLGRIGAFHTETLMGLPELDGLVITDERTEIVKQIADKYDYFDVLKLTSDSEAATAKAFGNREEIGCSMPPL